MKRHVRPATHVVLKSWLFRTCSLVVALGVLAGWFVGAAVPTSAVSAGSLDTSFGADGKVTTDFGRDEGVGALAIDADGKIVTGGTSSKDGYTFVLARYNTDGSLDRTFGGDGKVTTDFGGMFGELQGLAIDANGKIVAGGSTESGSSDTDFALARYNPDGSLDTSFDADGKVTTDLGGGDYVEAIAIDANGKIVAGGVSYPPANGFSLALARYNADGSLDTSFDADGKLTEEPGYNDQPLTSLVIDGDGKIVVGGADGVGVGADFAITRYNSDGSIDTNFVFTGWSYARDVVQDLAIDANGMIVAAGSTAPVGSGSGDFALARYNADGSRDASFGVKGKTKADFGGDDRGLALALDTNGRIVVGGSASDTSDTDFALARFNSDGSLDTSFGGDGKVTTDFGGYDGASSLAIDSNGKIVVGGSSSTSNSGDFALARYNAVRGGPFDLHASRIGHGRIRSHPAGISCGDVCVAAYDEGTMVTLSATPRPGWMLARWRQDCSASGSVCTLEMDSNQRAEAVFVRE